MSAAWKSGEAVESPSRDVWKQKKGLGVLWSAVCFLT